ncbi:MAG: HEAT repeat domain-containing protein [Planctomycetes bacterium]|nr:HEAT repeat domain-containing protein [Planctomycetota bacterium]
MLDLVVVGSILWVGVLAVRSLAFFDSGNEIVKAFARRFDRPLLVGSLAFLLLELTTLVVTARERSAWMDAREETDGRVLSTSIGVRTWLEAYPDPNAPPFYIEHTSYSVRVDYAYRTRGADGVPSPPSEAPTGAPGTGSLTADELRGEETVTTTENRAEAETREGAFRPGAPIRVYYDRRTPSRAGLTGEAPDVPFRGLVWLAALSVLFAGASGALALSVGTNPSAPTALVSSWKSAGRGLGIATRTNRWDRWGGLALEGTLARVSVTIDLGPPRFSFREPARTDIRAKGPELPQTLSLRAKESASPASASPAAKPLNVGAPGFEARIAVRGPELESLALLDSGTRGELLWWVGDLGGELVEGVLRVTLPERCEDAEQLEATVRRLVDLAGRLSVADLPVRSRLKRNAMSDPLAGVRHRNLEALVGRFGDSEEAREALLAAVGDEHPRERLYAALHLGAAGWRPLESLVDDRRAPQEVRTAALEHLAMTMPRERVLPVLERVLASRYSPLLPRAVRALALHRHSPALDAIAALLDGPAQPELVVAVAAALGTLGDARVEAPLLGLLGREDGRVRTAAAHALGLVGTLRAVEPLLGCAEAAVSLGSKGVDATARAAVKRIQVRLGSPDPGGLSLEKCPGPAVGALALAPAGGELSLPGSEPAGGPARPAEQSRQPPAVQAGGPDTSPVVHPE